MKNKKLHKKRVSKEPPPRLSEGNLRIPTRSIPKNKRLALNLTDRPQTSIKMKLKWRWKNKRRR